jgi:hypothetical protein
MQERDVRLDNWGSVGRCGDPSSCYTAAQATVSTKQNSSMTMFLAHNNNSNNSSKNSNSKHCTAIVHPISSMTMFLAHNNMGVYG